MSTTGCSSNINLTKNSNNQVLLDQEDGRENYFRKIQINILNLNVNKRPISAVADNIEFVKRKYKQK